MSFVSVLKKIAHGILWVPVELGKLFADLPKLITITSDAEKIGSDVLLNVIDVLKAVAKLVNATIKDGGVFLASFTALCAALAAAIESKALNIAADEAVLVAVENFASKFESANVVDLLDAWKDLVSATHKLDAAAVADLQKLEADLK